MAGIWTDENKFRIWLNVEILACEALVELGEMPGRSFTTIKEKADFDIERILEIEKTIKHDVIAFLTNVAEYVGPESRYIHLGMTSSDLLDTSLAVMLRKAGFLILQALENLKNVIGKRAVEFKETVCIGRSHGVHAEPTTFGLKLAIWYDEIDRCIRRIQTSIETISVGKISGAVGTFAHISPKVEEYVCKKLDLKPAPVSTQIVQRDRHAEFLTTLALIACSLDKYATEIRNLQRTEILEVEEFFTKGQKGSSAMPHKRNPIHCEQVCGLARVIRGNSLAAFENIALWHERDITHSSVERVILPDSTIILDYILHKFTDIVENLVVYPKNMQRNLDKTRGLVFSQALLLALAKKGITREESYRQVQESAMDVRESGGSFKEQALANEEINQYLSREEIENCFDVKKQLRNVDFIFERVGLMNEPINNFME